MARDYLKQGQALSHLETGSVHNSKATNTAVGMQISIGNRYEDVNGMDQESRIKLKFKNNIGIFGRKEKTIKTEDGEQHTLYKFDGRPHIRH